MRYRGSSRWKVSMTGWQARRHEATVEGRAIRFRPSEHAVLVALLVAPPLPPLRPRQLVERIWPNPDDEPDNPEALIKTHVVNLRRLGVPIETYRHWGYAIPAANREAAASKSAKSRRVTGEVGDFLHHPERWREGKMVFGRRSEDVAAELLALRRAGNASPAGPGEGGRPGRGTCAAGEAGGPGAALRL